MTGSPRPISCKEHTHDLPSGRTTFKYGRRKSNVQCERSQELVPKNLGSDSQPCAFPPPIPVANLEFSKKVAIIQQDSDPDGDAGREQSSDLGPGMCLLQLQQEPFWELNIYSDKEAE